MNKQSSRVKLDGSIKPHQTKDKKFFVGLMLLTALLAGGGYVYLNKPASRAERLFHSVLDNMISISGSQKVVMETFSGAGDSYLDMDVEYDSAKAYADTARMKLGYSVVQSEFTTTTEIEGLMFDLGNKDKQETYSRITKAEIDNEALKETFRRMNAPVLNVWAKAGYSDPDKSGGYETHGHFISLQIAAGFVLVGSDKLTAEQRTSVLDAIKEKELYAFEGNPENYNFDGREVTKIHVKMSKQGLIAVEEVLSGLNLPDGWYEQTDAKVIEQVFGSNEYITAAVYINEAEQRFEGAEIDFALPKPVVDRTYGTEIDRAVSRVSLKWGESLNMTKPTEYITQEEYDELIDRFNPAAEI